MAFHEVLFAYHDTPIGANLPTPPLLMSSYLFRSELPMINLTVTLMFWLRAQYKQEYIENIQPHKVYTRCWCMGTRSCVKTVALRNNH